MIYFLILVVALFPNVVDAAVLLQRNASRQLPPPVHIACIGDSITQGVPGPLAHSYPARLQELFGAKAVVKNFGRGWSSLMPPLAGFPPLVTSYETTPEYTAAAGSKPSIVVLMLGTNDAMGAAWTPLRSQAFVWHYTQLISKLRESYPAPKIHLGIEPPCYSATGASTGGNNQTVINTILPGLVRQVAQANSLGPPIDTFTLFATHCPDFTKGSTCNWMADGELHPNAHGYYQIASLVNQAIAGDASSLR
jgi:lysophospholipase L1-like esterase